MCKLRVQKSWGASDRSLFDISYYSPLKLKDHMQNYVVLPSFYPDAPKMTKYFVTPTDVSGMTVMLLYVPLSVLHCMLYQN